MRTHSSNSRSSNTDESISDMSDQVHQDCCTVVGYQCPTELHRTLIKVIRSKSGLIIQKLYE